MQDIETRIGKWLEEVREEYIRDVIEAVDIPSVSVLGEGEYPFGEECARMFDHMEQVLKRYGFPFRNHEYYCGSSLIKGSEGEGEIGIFSHLDVVPAGEGWASDPFRGHVDRGYIVGRGSNDNKGSAFACLYAVRFLKEHGIRLKNNLRLLYGCNEAAGMEDAKYYLRHYQAPDLTIVPDSWWPVSCSEKGVYIFDVHARAGSGNLLEFETIGADNTVPNLCTCLLETEEEGRIRDLAEKEDRIRWEREGEGKLRLRAYGIGAHASFPEGSESAVKLLADFLLANRLVTGEAKEALSFAAKSISDHNGKSLDIDFRDPFAGNTTHVLTRVKLSGGKLAFSYKICYPAAEHVDKEEVFRRLLRYFDREFLEIAEVKRSGPHFVEKGHPVADIFCRNASRVLGSEQRPFSQAGGTYAWWMPNAFAAGPGIHGSPQELFAEAGHGGAHQPDECVSIEGLMKGIRIYILSLLEIDGWLAGER